MVDNWGDIVIDKTTVKKLATVIRKHLPLDEQLPDPFEVPEIIQTFQSEDGFYDVWDAEREEAKLRELRKAARHLVSVERSLHPTVRDQIGLASKWVITAKDSHIRDRLPVSVLGYRSRDPLPDLFTIFAVLPEMLERSIKAGKRVIRHGRPLGRTNWLAIDLIVSCRSIWRQRKGNEAPKSLDPASPFGKFAKDVFDVIGMKGKPRSAMDAWRKVQSYYEKTD